MRKKKAVIPIQGWVKIGATWCAVYADGLTLCARLFGRRSFLAMGITGGVTAMYPFPPDNLPAGATKRQDMLDWVVSERPRYTKRCPECKDVLAGKPFSGQIERRWELLYANKNAGVIPPPVEEHSDG